MAQPNPSSSTYDYIEIARATYSYEAQQQDELSVVENDIVFIIDNTTDPDWPVCAFKSKSSPDVIGSVPGNYIEQAAPLYVARTVHAYEAQTEDELSFEAQTDVHVFQVFANDWMLASVVGTDGPSFGFVSVHYVASPTEPTEPTSPLLPATAHVEPRAVSPVAAPPPVEPPPEPAVSVAPATPAGPPRIARACYDYVPQRDDELDLREGETCLVLDDSDPDWALVKLISSVKARSNKQGYVPRSYLELKTLAKPPSTTAAATGTTMVISAERAGEGGVLRSPHEAPSSLYQKEQGKEERRRQEEEQQQQQQQQKEKEEAEKQQLRELEMQAQLQREREIEMEREREREREEAERKREQARLLELKQKKDEEAAAAAKAAAEREQARESEMEREREKQRKLEIERAQRERPPTTAPSSPLKSSVPTVLAPLATSPVTPAAPPPALPSRSSGPGSSSSSPPPPPLMPAAVVPPPGTPEPSAAVRGGSLPDPAQVRVWLDYSGLHRTDAAFLEFRDEKVRLHKTNGVKIEVHLDALSWDDQMHVLQRIGRPVYIYNHFDWLHFLHDVCGIQPHDAKGYAAKMVHERLDASVLPELSRDILRRLSVKEGDILRILKNIPTPANAATTAAPAVPTAGTTTTATTHVSSSSSSSSNETTMPADPLVLSNLERINQYFQERVTMQEKEHQIREDERIARELQSQEEAARSMAAAAAASRKASLASPTAPKTDAKPPSSSNVLEHATIAASTAAVPSQLGATTSGPGSKPTGGVRVMPEPMMAPAPTYASSALHLTHPPLASTAIAAPAIAPLPPPAAVPRALGAAMLAVPSTPPLIPPPSAQKNVMPTFIPTHQTSSMAQLPPAMYASMVPAAPVHASATPSYSMAAPGPAPMATVPAPHPMYAQPTYVMPTTQPSYLPIQPATAMYTPQPPNPLHNTYAAPSSLMATPVPNYAVSGGIPTNLYSAPNTLPTATTTTMSINKSASWQNATPDNPFGASKYPTSMPSNASLASFNAMNQPMNPMVPGYAAPMSSMTTTTVSSASLTTGMQAPQTNNDIYAAFRQPHYTSNGSLGQYQQR